MGWKYLEELIAKAKEGDESAFTDLILEIRNDLYKIARARLSQDDDVEEVIQETMIVAYKQIQQVKEPSKFKFWIIKILINNCNKKYNKKKKENQRYQPFDEFNYIPEDDQINRVENTLDFYNLIKNLTYEERMIMMLYYGEKYTSKEIAKLLKLKDNTVKGKIFRTREKLRTNNKEGTKIEK